MTRRQQDGAQDHLSYFFFYKALSFEMYYHMYDYVTTLRDSCFGNGNVILLNKEI